MRRGLCALLFLFSFLRSRCECEANPAGRSPERATGRQSRFYQRAVAEPAGEPDKGRRLDWPRFYQPGTGQRKPAMRKNGESGKHDGKRYE
jgi:hypothetical protein